MATLTVEKFRCGAYPGGHWPVSPEIFGSEEKTVRETRSGHGWGKAATTLAAAMVVVLSGCVSQEKYDAVVEENKKLQAAGMGLAERNVLLNAELLSRDLEVAQLKREQAELADDVTRWAAAGAVKMELLRDGLNLVLPNDVLFGSGIAKLKPEGRQLVTELVRELEANPYQIVVIGHSDNVPISASLATRYPSNWELAGARASSVVRVMVDEGIPPGRLLSVSVGDSRPLASNDSAEGRAQNRRVEVRLRPVVR